MQSLSILKVPQDMFKNAPHVKNFEKVPCSFKCCPLINAAPQK